MIFIGVGFILFSLVLRGMQLRKFLKNISTVCHIYDWKMVDENPERLLVIIDDEDYYTKEEWSAYKFLFLDGPSPLQMYFSFKYLILENFYNEENIEKIKNKIA